MEKRNTGFVDKYIRRSVVNGCIGYRVFIHRKDLQVNERFETIEKARAFRDEALRLCEAKRIQQVKVDLNFKEYPTNLINALGLDIEDVIGVFEEHLNEIKGMFTETELTVLDGVYVRCLTYNEIGKEIGKSSERVRQIHDKVLRKLSHRRRFLVLGEYATPKELAKRDYENYLNEIKPLWTYESTKEYIKNYEEQHKKEFTLEYPIEDLDLTIRSYHCLKRAEIRTIGDIKRVGIEGLMRVRNLGKKSMNEIIDKCKVYGVDITLYGSDEEDEEEEF